MFGQRYFDKEFERDDPWHLNNCKGQHVKYLRQIELIQLLTPAPASILEVGCAEGKHTAMLAQAFPGAAVTGVDISDAAVARAKELCSELQNVQFLQGDIDRLLRHRSLPLKQYDVILQSESLYYMFIGHVLRFRLRGYARDLVNKLTPEGIFVTCNSYAGVTKAVIASYFAALRSVAKPVYSKSYRDWFDSTPGYWNYEVRAYRRP